MSDLRTAAQQALECLKGVVVAHSYQSGTPVEAIAALKAALAEQRLTEVQQEMERSIESLKAALAQEQAEQAWVCPEAPEERTYSKPGYCKNCGRSLVLAQKQAEPVEEPVARDSTLNLAHQAGIVPGRPVTAAQLADLVALVRADEREACARIAERSPEKHWCVATIRARSKE